MAPGGPRRREDLLDAPFRSRREQEHEYEAHDACCDLAFTRGPHFAPTLPSREDGASPPSSRGLSIRAFTRDGKAVSSSLHGLGFANTRSFQRRVVSADES